MRFLRLLLAASLAMAAAAQQPAPAWIEGSVVHTSTNEPLIGATVELRAGGGEGLVLARTRSDGAGRFYLSNVPPGEHRLVAELAQFARAEFGQGHPSHPPQPLQVAPGARISGLRMAMTPAGSISGRLTENGKPVGIADVVAVRAIYVEGQLVLDPVIADRTDDNGEYHLFWLPPGRYHIIGIVWDTATGTGQFVNPNGNSNSFYAQRIILRSVFMRAIGSGASPDEAHVPFFYPGTTDPLKADVIEVTPGMDLHGVDFDVTTAPTRRVSGRVLGVPDSAGGQPVRVTVNMRPVSAMGATTNAAQAPSVQADASGNFEILRAVPGRYVIMATAGAFVARSYMEVADRDVNGVTLTVAPGFSISGRVVIERQTPMNPDPALPGLRVTLRSDPPVAGTPTYTAQVRPDGSFTMPLAPANPNAQAPAGIAPGDYRVLVTPLLTAPAVPGAVVPELPAPLRGMYVKSIGFGDRDVLSSRLELHSPPQDPLTIAIGTRPASLAGQAIDDRQQQVRATVVLIPVGGLRHRVNHPFTFSNDSGEFRFEDVPPGNYELFAWEEVERGAWQDPSFLRDFASQGTPVQIQEGQAATASIRVIPRR